MRQRLRWAMFAALIVGAASSLRAQTPSSLPPPPTIPPATLDETLDISGETLAAKQRNTRLSIPVRVNGQGPFRFLVDSGADRTVIGAGLAARLALPAGPSVQLNGMAGQSRVATARIDALDIGSTRIDDIVAPALPEMFLGAQGILGIDALVDQRLKLDFERRTITVQDKRAPETSSPDEIVVVARRHHGQLILALTSVGTLHLYGIIDTGSEVTVGNSALLARIFRSRHPPPSQPVTLTSVTGEKVEAQLITLPELRIGDLILSGVPVAFADVPPFALFGLADQPALMLGTDTLQTFARVSLDFGRRRVRFQLRR